MLLATAAISLRETSGVNLTDEQCEKLIAAFEDLDFKSIIINHLADNVPDLSIAAYSVEVD